MESSPPPKPKGRLEGKKPKRVRGRGSHWADGGVNSKAVGNESNVGTRAAVGNTSASVGM